MPNTSAPGDVARRHQRENLCLELAAADGTMSFSRMAELITNAGLASDRYRATQCKRDFIRALNRTTDRETAKKARQLTNLRVATLMRGLWPDARQGDTKAVDSLVRLMDFQARLLGLYAPQRTQLEISAFIQEVGDVSVGAVAFGMAHANLSPADQQRVLDGVRQYLSQAGGSGGQVIELAAITAGGDDDDEA